MKYVCLTIDDGPSRLMNDLLDYLSAKEIGAILFCRGDYLEERRSTAIRAIHDEYIIGNHSYDHPHFRTLTEDQVRIQITRTDEIINQIYAEADVKRPCKYFRFPYSDAGVENNKLILHEYGYPPDPVTYVHVEDWKVDESNVEQKLEFAKQKSRRQLYPGVVLDLHDHESNFKFRLFQRICDFIPELGFTFYSNKQLQEHAHCTTGPLFP